jgi:phenylacetate-CoA ligase
MYSTEITYQPPEKIKIMQEKKLQKLLLYLQQKSPFYKDLFAREHINISTVKTIEDLTLIPVTTKEDLQKRNNDFLCVDANKIIEYSSTSGTLGSPVSIALTENDLNRLTYNEYSSFLCADTTSEDIFQLMLTLDRQFMAGMAYYSGLRKLGAGIIRLGPGVPSMQWETIFKIKPTAIVAVPSFILKLIQYAQEHNIDINASSVKRAICIGENMRNTDFSLNILGKKITDAWNIHLYSTYASTEMQTAFTECRYSKGGHHQPELIILEFLGEDNQPVAPGEPGEITITTLDVEGMPLLRYKTGDICLHFTDQCECGRTTVRISPIIGRKKQMIKFKGTTLYPPALFDILNEMEEIQEYVAEVYSNEIGMDEVLLHLLPVNTTEETDRKIRAYIQAKLRVSPHIQYVTVEQISKLQSTETSRKPVKFIDKR